MESKRQSADAKAKETKREQEHQAFLDTQERDDQVKEAITNRLLQNPDIDNGEIIAEISKTYGQEVADRYAPQMAAIRSREMATRFQEGRKLAELMETEEEADAFINANPHLSQGEIDGIRKQVARNARDAERQRGEQVLSIANTLPAEQFKDDGSSRAMVERMVKRAPMTRSLSPEQQREVADDIIEIWRSRETGAEQARDIGVDTKQREAIAVGSPGAIETSARIGAEEAEANRKRFEQTIARIDGMPTAIAAELEASMPPDSKAKPSAKEKRNMVFELRSKYILSPEQTQKVMAAYDGTDRDALVEAIAEARADPKTRSISDVQQMQRRQADFANPMTGTGDLRTDYRAFIKDDMQQTGRYLAAGGQKWRASKNVGYNDGATQLVDELVQSTQKQVLNMRNLVQQAGFYSASAEEVREAEAQLIRDYIDAWGAGAQMTPDEFRNILQEVTLRVTRGVDAPRNVQARISQQDRFAGAYNAAQRGAGVRETVQGSGRDASVAPAREAPSQYLSLIHI